MTMMSFRISTQNLWGVESGISPKKTVPRWVCSCGDIALSRMEPQAKWVGCYSCSLRTVESWKTASLEWIGQRIPHISCDCHVSLTSTSLVEKLLSSPYNDRGYRRSYGDRRDANRRPEENENWRELPWICLFTYIFVATWYKPDPTSILLMTRGKLQKSISKLRYGRLVINLETWKTNRLIDQSSIHCSFLQNTRQRQKIMWSSETFAQLCAPVRSSCPQRSFIGQPRSIPFATCPRVTHHQRLWSGSSSGV